MKILKIHDGNAKIRVNEDLDVSPVDFSRDNLLELLNHIYNSSEELVFPNNDELSCIKNAVEKEIVSQLITKFKEFNINKVNIQNDISANFPDITSK